MSFLVHCASPNPNPDIVNAVTQDKTQAKGSMQAHCPAHKKNSVIARGLLLKILHIFHVIIDKP